jgi:cobyrinic acid a,c-diamide synthase
MRVTKQIVADKLAAYLRHELSLKQLVNWAENAMLEGDFDQRSSKALSAVVARLGVADVRTFSLSWEDCGELLRQLGFQARVEIVAS